MTATAPETITAAQEKAWQEYWDKLLINYPATAQSIIRGGMVGYIKNGFIYGFHSGIDFTIREVKEIL